MAREVVKAIHDLDQEEQLEALEELLGGLTVGTLVKLVPRLEEAWDVQAVPKMGGVVPEKAEEEEAEQTEFSVVVTDLGPKKIQVIKAIRKLTDLDLKSSKAVVDKGLPAVVQEKLARDMAENAKKQLEEAGATAEIK